MKVLVAGGAGFIGSHLVDRVLAQDERNEVVVVDDLSSGTWKNLPEDNPRLTCVQASLINYTTPPTEPLYRFEDVELVFHLASPCSPPRYLPRPVETLRAGSVATERLLMFCAEVSARFVLASTSEVYGDPQVHPQHEGYRGNVDPASPRSCYDEAKRYAEAITLAYHRARGVDVRIARIFNSYGPRLGDDGRVLSNMVRQALRGEWLTVYGDGAQTRSFCYVGDTVEGLLRLAGATSPDAHLPVNIGNPGEVKIADLARLVLRLVNRPETEIAFQDDARAVGDPERRCPDITRAQELLGWSPRVGLEEGLARMIAWFRERT